MSESISGSVNTNGTSVSSTSLIETNKGDSLPVRLVARSRNSQFLGDFENPIRPKACF